MGKRELVPLYYSEICIVLGDLNSGNLYWEDLALNALAASFDASLTALSPPLHVAITDNALDFSDVKHLTGIGIRYHRIVVARFHQRLY